MAMMFEAETLGARACPMAPALDVATELDAETATDREGPTAGALPVIPTVLIAAAGERALPVALARSVSDTLEMDVAGVRAWPTAGARPVTGLLLAEIATARAKATAPARPVGTVTTGPPSVWRRRLNYQPVTTAGSSSAHSIWTATVQVPVAGTATDSITIPSFCSNNNGYSSEVSLCQRMVPG